MSDGSHRGEIDDVLASIQRLLAEGGTRTRQSASTARGGGEMPAQRIGAEHPAFLLGAELRVAGQSAGERPSRSLGNDVDENGPPIDLAAFEVSSHPPRTEIDAMGDADGGEPGRASPKDAQATPDPYDADEAEGPHVLQPHMRVTKPASTDPKQAAREAWVSAKGERTFEAFRRNHGANEHAVRTPGLAEGHPASFDRAQAAAPAGPNAHDHDPSALREVVARLIREELQGNQADEGILGLRALVREEVRRALGQDKADPS